VNPRAFDGLSQIGQINVRVHDLARATAFYRDQLRVKFLFDVPNMAFFDCAGVRLLLALPEGEGSDHNSSILYFKVDDIHDATEALRARSVKITSEPHLIAHMPDHDLWMSFFEDSEGNTMALMAEVREAG
jgi:methylmalonyl-CoA/ethylmalonyl-CoA epimerase